MSKYAFLLHLTILAFCALDAHAQCTWQFLPNALDVKCALRTASIDATQPLDLQIAESANRLQLQCDTTAPESPAATATAAPWPTNLFARLQKLTELQVESCKLQRLPAASFDGLLSLKRLSVRTQNAQHGKTLELQTQTFYGLRELQTLELSDNNMRQLPDGLWCALPNLQALNLTRNRLRSAEQLGFSDKPCAGATTSAVGGGQELQTLDLAYNELRALPDAWCGTRLRRLETLALQHNNLTSVGAQALAGLGALRILNLSYNHLETLPAALFAANKQLRELHLQGNGLYELPSGLLQRLEELLILDLSDNQLISHHVDNATFDGLIRLVVLNLANNGLTRIGAKTFKELYFLQSLDLSNNSIGHIEDGAFAPLYNLNKLNLAENRLHTLDNRLLSGLYVLEKLTLNNNLIALIEPRAFRNCSDLKELDLSSNQLAEVPEAIQDLGMLKNLDLGENMISGFKNGTFRNLQQLTGLRLIDNRIGNITATMFAELPRLSVLNIAKNRIQLIEHGAFTHNKELEAIRLDKNFLTDVNGVFAALASLLWLNLSDNHLVWFDYAFIPANLKWLDIHGNYIESLGNYYKLQEELRVETLDASHNRITEIGPMSVPNSIQMFFINHNIISQIQPNTFVDKVRLKRVDLYANVLSRLSLNALRVAPVALERPLPDFYMAGNPYECDCSMEWLQRINNLTTRQHPRIVDLGAVECLMPHNRHAPVRRLEALASSDFVCKYERNCPATCQCCDFDNCPCESVCPANCTCFHDATWSTNIVDCGHQARLDFSTAVRLPDALTELYLDGNNLPALDASLAIYAGKQQLRALYLNASNIVSLGNDSFRELPALRTLHLEHNKLQTLNGHEFESLAQLHELYLQSNLLTHIANGTFEPLTALKLLRLDNNRLSALAIAPLVQLQARSSLQGLTMGRNIWSCDCQFLQRLSNFVTDNALVLRDAHDIYCIDDGVKRELPATALDCASLPAINMAATDMPVGVLPMLAAILVLILLIVVLIVVFVFRESVRVWLFAHYGVRVCEPRFEAAGKLYDAIILHSAADYEFVCRNIANELEHGRPPFRLCIQQRDLPPQASQLQLVEAARASRKLILVLTRNLLTSEWQRLEFRNAFHAALRGLAQKLVIIEESSVSAAAEDVAELAPYLKSVPSNRLLTCDRYFWEKLRYAIPIELSTRGNNYTIDHHERFKQPVSPGMIFRQAPPPPPPPAYYCTEDLEANYSSATTATPSPRPTRHGAAVGGMRMIEALPMRPPSEHIYHSIESEYGAYDHEALSMIPNGGGTAAYMHHHHHNHHQHAQQQQAWQQHQLLMPAAGNNYRLQQQQQRLLLQPSSIAEPQWLTSQQQQQQQQQQIAPLHLRSGSNLSQTSTSTQSTAAQAQQQPLASTSAAAAAIAAEQSLQATTATAVEQTSSTTTPAAAATATATTPATTATGNKNNGQSFLV